MIKTRHLDLEKGLRKALENELLSINRRLDPKSVAAFIDDASRILSEQSVWAEEFIGKASTFDETYCNPPNK